MGYCSRHRHLHIPQSVKQSCQVCKVWITEQNKAHCPPAPSSPLSSNTDSVYYRTVCWFTLNRNTRRWYWHPIRMTGGWRGARSRDQIRINTDPGNTEWWHYQMPNTPQQFHKTLNFTTLGRSLIIKTAEIQAKTEAGRCCNVIGLNVSLNLRSKNI